MKWILNYVSILKISSLLFIYIILLLFPIINDDFVFDIVFFCSGLNFIIIIYLFMKFYDDDDNAVVDEFLLLK